MVIIKSIDTVWKQHEELVNTEKGIPIFVNIVLQGTVINMEKPEPSSTLSFGPWWPVRKILKNPLQDCGRITNDFQ